jgi:LmbE family N-acetylglucosaminyl deacetylase
MELEFKKLANTVSVLYIAAHPDDENTRLISWLVNEKCVRTGYLSLTRGDGGQNLIGSEQGIALGVIRSQELLAARRVDGAEQFFTRAFDFGYSKTPEETFEKWNREEILADVVYVIRKFRPDIIITRFATDGSGGHGHHTASAMLAEEAFEAAADPSRFPKQLKTVNIWQSKRLLYNSAARFWNPNADMSSFVPEDVGGFNQALGKSYGEISAESRSMHRSQGFGSAKQRGQMLEHFKPLKGDTFQLKNLFDRIDLGYSKLPIAKKRKQLINAAAKDYLNQNINACTQKLLQVLALQSQYKEEDYNYKYQQIIATILRVNGIFLEACSEGSAAFSAGDSIKIKVNGINRSQTSATLHQVNLEFLGSNQNCPQAVMQQLVEDKLETNKIVGIQLAAKVCAEASASSMFWLNQNLEDNKFLMQPTQVGLAYALQSSYQVQFTLSVLNQKIQYTAPVMFKFTHPEKGEIYRNTLITPPAMVNVSSNVLVCNDTLPRMVKVSLKAGRDNVSGIIRAVHNGSWKITAKNASKTTDFVCEMPFYIGKKMEELDLAFSISASALSAETKVNFELIIDSTKYNKGYEEIIYDHIPTQVLFPNAELKLVKIEVQKKLKKLGYIKGAGDEIAERLNQIGYEVISLTDEQIANENLFEFESIIIGVRAYNTNEKLSIYKSKLMNYVANGGNLIVQYNTNSFAGPFKGDIGPYPFKISRERITDENAKVVFENPAHPVLNKPNKISESDFEGWIQERSIYQAGEMDSRYENILNMADPNAKSTGGSLIIGKYGKGYFIYTGLVFFRELPAGVPGAYRLFVNLIELGK